ncbi:hypothetical protein DMN91_011992 [Ooceraea biroi]|uniref:DNA polymerase eta n=3 Tax=Ooceraea biroi TaxID=2015173 RepID=A0A3L8D811_OOCBI|nr:DNA polymerase eta isoform X1 [Ooceraea biroi]XP_011350836.2 DNA polymerase eta isoform X1 [Ooceraea biroi]XP_026830084.1 DNA polymerase eta isoform X1 [Ooceraea biroi]RLU16232.1 hypothetical protein DMN91_011992 [Ooceraea biroi]
MASLGNRIVVLIDMDCFFCQVETKLQPRYEGKPLAVVQYNQWEMGGIIAVNYEARSFGVTRHMRGKEAKEKCPDIVLASVPCLRGKADTSRYRKAGRQVIEVLRKHCNMVERASVDEAYLDLTDIVDEKLAANEISSKEMMSYLANTYVVGYSEVDKNDEDDRRRGLKTWVLDSFSELHDARAQKLAIAGVIVEEIRASIYRETGFRCSAGIAQNKILAKLACGLHKPNRQTILPEAAIASLYSTLPVRKVRNLGGKLGDVVVESLGCNVMSDLRQYSLEKLQKQFDEKTGFWLYNIARGVDNEPVSNRLLAKSIGACKKFPGKQAITSLELLRHWAGDLAAEVCERLEEDLVESQRRATLLTVSYHYYQNKRTVSQTRSLALNSYKPEKMASQCVDVVTKSTQCPVAYLGFAASKFVPSKESGSFLKFFKNAKSERSKVNSEACKSLDVVASSVDSMNSEATEANTPAIISEKDSPDEESIKSQITMMRRGNKKTVENSILNTSMKNSPTSKRVSKLMQVCSEHVEVKSKNKRLSGLIIDNNDFQDSFFMNVYKTKGKEERSSEVEAAEEPECETITSTDTERDASDEIVDDRSSNLYVQENSKPSTSYTPTHVSSNDEPARESNETRTREPVARLREIFPDLNDMDPEVLSLLPADLQEAARPYRQPRDKKQESVRVTRGGRGKSGKSKAAGKSGKRRSPLYNFLIKTDSREHDVPLERCAECDQLIAVTRFSEHVDFHVAQNLYREINKPASGEKRKLEDAEAGTATSVKRQTPEKYRHDGDSRSITTFLS